MPIFNSEAKKKVEEEKKNWEFPSRGNGLEFLVTLTANQMHSLLSENNVLSTSFSDEGRDYTLYSKKRTGKNFAYGCGSCHQIVLGQPRIDIETGFFHRLAGKEEVIRYFCRGCNKQIYELKC